MIYSSCKYTLFVLGLAIGSYAQGMELARQAEKSCEAKTFGEHFFPSDFPRELKWYIISLFLEIQLNYNFVYSMEFLIGKGALTARRPEGTTVHTSFCEGTARLWDVKTRQLDLYYKYTMIELLQ